MTTLVVDASVWVPAADAAGGWSESSRAFLSLTEVVSWDGELIDRAGASTPTDWIERNA